MNCHQFHDFLDYLLQAPSGAMLDAAAAEHVKYCPACRQEHQAAMDTLSLLQPSMEPVSTSNLKERIMRTIETTATERVEVKTNGMSFWKPAFAAAAVALLALLIYTLWQPKTAYAIAQTLEAARTVRSLHVVITPVAYGSVGEVWAEFGENGHLQKLKMRYPETEDGAKDVLWANEQAQVWFHDKNGIVTLNRPNALRGFEQQFTILDPVRIVEGLYRQKEEGTAKIDIQEPAGPGQPIVVTLDSDSPEARSVYTVDPDTLLLQKYEVYRPASGALQLQVTHEYFDYNSVDAAAFVFDAPADVVRVDNTKPAGLHQGTLSDEEIAAQVVREFFEALIAKDYEKAGSLFGGIPAAEMERMFSHINVVRIISIDAPVPHEPTRSLKVPIKVELEKDGQLQPWEPHGPLVREIDENLPGYWAIHGGI